MGSSGIYLIDKAIGQSDTVWKTGQLGTLLKVERYLLPEVCRLSLFCPIFLSTEQPMKNFQLAAFAVVTLLTTAAYANDPKATIAALDARLVKIGEPKLEGTEKAGELTVPAIFFGTRKINNNYDVVDEIKKTTGATATVFVKHGDDYIRVSTNVLTPEGKRGVGTPLAKAKAYEAVNKGEGYCGQVDVLGTPFDACYNPIKDKGGKVIGVSYIGFKK